MRISLPEVILIVPTNAPSDLNFHKNLQRYKSSVERAFYY